MDFLLPDGVGPTDAEAAASPDLDRALVGFTDFALPGLMDTSREDDGPAGTTVNSGA